MIAMTVYDNKAKYYLTPFFVNTRGEGLRQFIHACNDPSHQFHLYAEDFTLLECGQFDPQSGIMVSQELEPIGRAWELKNVQSGIAQGDLPLTGENNANE